MDIALFETFVPCTVKMIILPHFRKGSMYPVAKKNLISGQLESIIAFIGGMFLSLLFVCASGNGSWSLVHTT